MGGDDAWLADAARLSTIEAVAGRIEPSFLEEESSTSAEGAVLGATPEGGIVIGGAVEPQARRAASVLRHMPWSLPFGSRLGLLRRWLNSAREEASYQQMHAFQPTPWHPVEVRRPHLFDDAFSSLRGLGAGWRLPVRARFFGAEGLEEAGIGEGVAKEFLVEVLREGFDPARGLFCTGAEGALYPNPAAAVRVPEAYSYFEFLGAVLAKTLWEGILVELPLAPFFLNLLLGRTNTRNDLPALDPLLARSLAFLMRFEGDFDSLCLNFAIAQYVDESLPAAARSREIALKPGGAQLAVSRENRVEYTFLVAHYRLNVQLRRAADAFLRGFACVVPGSWVRLFSPKELQLVLGGSDAPVDVDDWQRHAQYSGGYHEEHPVVGWFWRVLDEFTPARRAAALKFATSCSRPPLMGFRWLQPMFCIHKASNEEGRLPTSATCMNLLKLPPYDSIETLREKLIYAIEAGAGFELS